VTPFSAKKSLGRSRLCVDVEKKSGEACNLTAAGRLGYAMPARGAGSDVAARCLCAEDSFNSQGACALFVLAYCPAALWHAWFMPGIAYVTLN